MKSNTKPRTWVEIDIEALRHNIARLKKFLKPETKLMAVVKSNAYGHGMVLCAEVFVKAGADFLAVDDFSEALELRSAKIKTPILVLGYTLPEHFTEAVRKNISITVSSIESLEEIKKSRFGFKKIKVHVKVDTGLHRQGFLHSERYKVTALLLALKKKLIIEGLYTHFAALESPQYIDYSRMQGERLATWQDAFLNAGFDPIVHASASAGIVWAQDDFHFDMVRAGIALYGLWPSDDIRRVADKTELKPVMSWRTVVGEVKKISAGSRIGYDLTESVPHDATLAIIPVGYWHGYPRHLSSVGEVLVKGKRAKIVGRISMDMTIVDVTDIPLVKAGTVVTLIGKDGSSAMTAEEVAKKADTINYEIVTRINPLIPRITA